MDEIQKMQELLNRVNNDPGAWRGDATITSFTERQLVHVNSEMFRIDLPQFRFREFLDVDNSVPAGARFYGYHETERVGEAEVTDDTSGDSPRITSHKTETLVSGVSIRDHYAYTQQDMREAMMAGVNLDVEEALNAREAIEEKLDYVAAFGHAATGVAGFLNNSAVTAANVASGAVDTEWSTKTADEILTDIISAHAAIVAATNDVEGRECDLLLPPSQYYIFTEKRFADINSTPLKFVRENFPWLRSVNSWYQLSGAGASSTDRFVLYSKDPRKVKAIIPMELYAYAPEIRGTTWRVEMEARTMGVEFKKPKSAVYRDAI